MGYILPTRLLDTDRQLLKALRIRVDEDIAEGLDAPRAATPHFDETAYQATIWRAAEAQKGLGPRDEEGHPLAFVEQYRLTPAARRLDAVQQRYYAHQAGQRCRCGALHPSACCYL